MANQNPEISHLKPFQGIPNPGGRPKVYKEFKLWCQDMLPEAKEYLTRMIRDNEEKGDRKFAIQNILQYGIGKPEQRHKIEDSREHTKASELTTAELDAKIAEAEALIGARKDESYK